MKIVNIIFLDCIEIVLMLCNVMLIEPEAAAGLGLLGLSKYFLTLLHI